MLLLAAAVVIGWLALRPDPSTPGGDLPSDAEQDAGTPPNADPAGAPLPDGRESAATRAGTTKTGSGISSDAPGPAQTRHVPADTAAAQATAAQAPGPDAATDEDRFPQDWRRCLRDSNRHAGYSITSDSGSAWAGSWSAKITSLVDRPNPSGAALCQAIDAADYQGRRVRLTLHMRTRDAMPGAHLVLRADARDGRVVAFSDMAPRRVSGTTGWAAYSAVMDVPAQAAVIVVGGALISTGTAWFDDASLEVVDPEVPLTSRQPAHTGWYVLPIDPAALPKTLQNTGFENARPVSAEQ